VPPADVAAFEKEMRDAKVDWQFAVYGNTVHAFTDKATGNDNSRGAAYNEQVNRRSWIAMQDFFSRGVAEIANSEAQLKVRADLMTRNPASALLLKGGLQVEIAARPEKCQRWKQV
jgi:hypothetical protein